MLVARALLVALLLAPPALAWGSPSHPMPPTMIGVGTGSIDTPATGQHCDGVPMAFASRWVQGEPLPGDVFNQRPEDAIYEVVINWDAFYGANGLDCGYYFAIGHSWMSNDGIWAVDDFAEANGTYTATDYYQQTKIVITPADDSVAFALYVGTTDFVTWSQVVHGTLPRLQ